MMKIKIKGSSLPSDIFLCESQCKSILKKKKKLHRIFPEIPNGSFPVWVFLSTQSSEWKPEQPF